MAPPAIPAMSAVAVGGRNDRKPQREMRNAVPYTTTLTIAGACEAVNFSRNAHIP